MTIAIAEKNEIGNESDTIDSVLVDLAGGSTEFVARPPSEVSACDSHAEPHFGSAEIIRDVIVGYVIYLELLVTFKYANYICM